MACCLILTPYDQECTKAIMVNFWRGSKSQGLRAQPWNQTVWDGRQALPCVCSDFEQVLSFANPQ